MNELEKKKNKTKSDYFAVISIAKFLLYTTVL